MSHFTKVETKLKDLSTLKAACGRLGMDVLRAEVGRTLQVKGLENQGVDVDLVVKTGSAYNIGFRIAEDHSCEVVADWWAIETFTGRTQQDYLNSLTREYAYVTVMDRMKEMGYSVVTEEESATQQIRLVVRKWD